MTPAIVIVLPVPVAPSSVVQRSPAVRRSAIAVDRLRLVGGGGEDRVEAELGHEHLNVPADAAIERPQSGDRGTGSRSRVRYSGKG